MNKAINVTALRERLRSLWLSVYKSQYSYLSLCFLIPFGLMLLMYVCRGIHPLGNSCVLVLDLNGQYVYFYEALREFIYGDTSLLYSFSRALGGEFLGIYAYYIASPLSWLVALFPEGRMLEALLFIFLLKTGLCGFTCGWYLHKTTRRTNKNYVLIFSILYALCAYAIVHQHNSMWIDALIWLPIITYAIEDLIKHRHYKLFVISLAITIMSNFYIGYMVCIYVALYFFYYFVSCENSNPLEESLHFLKSLFRIGAWSLLAVGISAVIIAGAYYSLGFGKTTFTDPNWDFFARFTLADLFVKLLPGAYDTVRPAGLPMIYCGVLTLLMIPFYYLRKDISLREKLLSTLFIAIFVLSFIINPIDLVWHGLQKPTWLNYRYSFMLSFFLLLLGYKGLLGIRKQKASVVLQTGLILFLSVVILQQFEYDSFLLDKYGLEAGKLAPFRTVWFTIIMIVSLCAILSMIIHAKRPRDVRKYALILLLVICAETFANGFILLSDLDIDVSFSTYSSYNDYLDPLRIAADQVQELDTSFYRMEKTRMRKTNDDMALNMRGLSCSTSTLNKETIYFLKALGYTSYSNRSKYMGETPVADSLLGVKYVLSEATVSETRSDYNEDRALASLMSELYTVYTETYDYVAYQNPYALSLAYTVDEAIKDLTFYAFDENDKPTSLIASPMERLNAFLAAAIGESDFRVFYPINTGTPTYDNCRKSSVVGNTKYSVSDSAAASTVSFTATMPSDAYVFFYAPSDYPRDTKIAVNDKKFGDYMTNDSDRIKTLGKFSEGEKITVTLTLKESNFYLKNNEYVLYYMDVSQFQYAMNKLATEQFIIEDYTETKLNGTITTSHTGETVLTTIPYDEGWQVIVDGKPVEIFKAMDALIAFDIEEAGTHTLTLRYAPRLIILGAALSINSTLLFAAIVTHEHLSKKKQAKAHPAASKTS